MPVKEAFFDDQDSLLSALAQQLQQQLAADLQQADAVSCLLSGGSSPAPLYRLLSEADLPWQRIHAALVDERWVDANDPASNENLLRTTLKQNAAAGVHIQGMKNQAALPAAGVEACEHDYRQLPEPWSFCLLGMGTDGHTASLFPESTGLLAAVTEDRLCYPITAQRSSVTGDRLQRMSIGISAMQRCRQRILLISGEKKLQVYRQALICKQQALMPVAYVLQHPEMTTTVYWSP